jgi:hypothetical protein
VDANILSLGREMRLSYLPPLMVCAAYGISGLTGIVGTFFVKDYLGLSAAFLAALGFWVGIPWVLKMPLGHIVDLVWRWKSGLVFLNQEIVFTGSMAIIVTLIAWLTKELEPAARATLIGTALPADYSQPGELLILQWLLAAALPLAAILVVRALGLRWA